MKKSSEGFFAFLFPFLVVGLFVLGAALVLKDTLGLLPSLGTELLRLVPFFILSLLLFIYAKKSFLYVFPFLFCVGTVIFYFGSIAEGIPALADAVRTVLATGQAAEIPANLQKPLSDMLHVLFCILIAVTGYSVSAKGSAFGLILSEFPFFLLLLIMPHTVQLVSALCLLFSVLLVFLFVINKNIATTSDRGKGFRDTEELLENRPYSVVFSAIPVLLLSVLCLLPLFGKQEDYTEKLPAKRFRQTMQQTSLFEAFLPYNRGLDNGTFRDRKDLAYSGETALRIKTDRKKGFLYLNGFSGAVYTNTGWKDVKKEEYEALEKRMNGIDPRNLRAMYNSFTNKGGSSESITVCREYCDGSVFYLPNGLKTDPASIDGTDVKFDTRVGTKFLHRTWEYSVEAYPKNHSMSSKLSVNRMDADSIYSAYTNASGRALKKVSGSSAEAFRDAAESYTAYVLDTYTQLPEETVRNAESLLKSLNLEQSGSKLDLKKTVDNVRKALNRELTYSMDKVNISSSSDFTSTLLLSKKEGSYKHFATAACVLLRAMHIPCRYAEGYIILPEDYENTDADGFTLIPDNHARAWIELYDPCLFDWIPFDLSFQSGEEGVSALEDESEENENESGQEAEDNGEAEDSGETEEGASGSDSESPTEENNEIPDMSGENETPHDEQGSSGSEENPENGLSGSDTASGDNGPGSGNTLEEDGFSDDSTSAFPEEEQPEEETPPYAFPWWILLLLVPAAVHFTLYGYRKYRLEKQDPYKALFYASGLYLNMMRFLTGERYLPSDSPVSYLERSIKANPAKEDRLFLERVQAVRFGDEVQEESDRETCNALLKARYKNTLSLLPVYKKPFFLYLYRM